MRDAGYVSIWNITARRQGLAHVLSIDDDPMIRRLIGGALVSEGHRVSEAGNGAEAQRLLVGPRFDLILLDLQLPDVSGEKLLVSIRGNPTHAGTPVLMVTGEADMSVADDLRNKGANGYLVKPFRPEQLVKRVEGLLEMATG